MQKQDLYIGSHKTPTSDIDWKWGDGKIIPRKWKSKKAGLAILISDKIDFKLKTVIRDKERHYIMIKGSFQEEDLTIENIHPK